MSDAQLIEEVKLGNIAVFKQLMTKYERMVFRTAMGFVHIKEDAEDLTQEVFIQVYQSLSKFKGDAEFSTWLYRIVVNMSINFVNRNKKNRLLESLETIFHPSSNEKTPLEQLEQSERDKRIKKAINSLSDEQRTAFVLSKYEELSQKEIATIMKKSEGAVEQLLQRAKQNLQKKLRPSRRKLNK